MNLVNVVRMLYATKINNGMRHYCGHVYNVELQFRHFRPPVCLGSEIKWTRPT